MKVAWPGRTFLSRLWPAAPAFVQALHDLYDRTGGPIDRFDGVEVGQIGLGILVAAVRDIETRLIALEQQQAPSGSVLMALRSLEERLASVEVQQGDAPVPTAGVGGITGPTTTTDSTLARWDGAGGRRLKGSPVAVDDSGNVSGAGSVAAASADVTGTYSVSGTPVVGARKTGWTPSTGTASRGAYAAYVAPTIGGAYSQSQVQAIADALQAASRRLVALETDTTTHGLIGA